MDNIHSPIVNIKLKLGKRLQHIESLVAAQYDHIWDCCCDHGLLGAALLSRQAAPNIHFVDVVPELMQTLENKLTRFFADSVSNWQVHCMDVAKLPLWDFVGKHLVIIAGVGGDLMSEFVKAIYQHNPNTEIDFLLCPVHHQYTLRQQLIQLHCSLVSESLMVENERYYEMLLVSATPNSQAKINPVGASIWETHTSEQSDIARTYLHKTLAHYKRMQLGQNTDVQSIIDAYTAVLIKDQTKLQR